MTKKISNSLKRFKKVSLPKQPELAQIQNNIEEALNPVINSNIVDGVLIKDLSLTALKANLILHKLGRDPLGWIVVRKRADSRIWDVQDSNTQSDRTIAITCSHDVTIDLWVF